MRSKSLRFGISDTQGFYPSFLAEILTSHILSPKRTNESYAFDFWGAVIINTNWKTGPRKQKKIHKKISTVDMPRNREQWAPFTLSHEKSSTMQPKSRSNVMGLLWAVTQQTAWANSSYLICEINYLSKVFYNYILLFIGLTLVPTVLNCMKHCTNLIESQLANMFGEISLGCRSIWPNCG